MTTCPVCGATFPAVVKACYDAGCPNDRTFRADDWKSAVSWGYRTGKLSLRPLPAPTPRKIYTQPVSPRKSWAEKVAEAQEQSKDLPE